MRSDLKSGGIKKAGASPHQLALKAVHTADIRHILVAHLPDHGDGLARAGSALAVDVDRSSDVPHVIYYKMNAVEGYIDRTLDMAGFVFRAGSYVNEKGAGGCPELLDSGVDISFIKQFI